MNRDDTRLCDRHFNDMCDKRSKRLGKGDPTEATRGRHACPAGFLGSEIQHSQRSRIVGDQLATIAVRILALAMRELVDEASRAKTLGPNPVVRSTDVGTPTFSSLKSTRTCGTR